MTELLAAFAIAVWILIMTYLMVRVGAFAWFQAKREYTRLTLSDLVDDNHGETK